MDDIDRRLLVLLQTNGRMEYQELGNAVGLSAPATFQRVRKLERRGVIVGWHARVAPERVGRPIVAFLRVVPGAETDERGLLERWRAAPEILEYHQLSGEVGYLLKLRIGHVRDVTPHAEAVRAAGCRVVADVALGGSFERWAVPVTGGSRAV